MSNAAVAVAALLVITWHRMSVIGTARKVAILHTILRFANREGMHVACTVEKRAGSEEGRYAHDEPAAGSERNLSIPLARSPRHSGDCPHGGASSRCLKALNTLKCNPNATVATCSRSNTDRFDVIRSPTKSAQDESAFPVA